jgi:TonB family protein
MAAARLGRRDAYGMAVRAAVAQSVQAPGEAGEVKLAFRIEPDGRVVQVRIISSSGNRRVDGAALAAARTAPFPPRPRELAGQTLSYDITLTFTIGP